MERMIYLDHAATTPVRPEVRAAMEPYLWARSGNASSTHAGGREARAALESARERVAAALGGHRTEIVFTGGGTEADNLAVLGRWRAVGGGLAVSAIEHSAVLEPAAQAAREGAELTILAVREDGLLEAGALEEALETPQAVVSVMWGNNEVGTVQPIGQVVALCRSRGVAVHSDAVQAVGQVPVSVADVGVDLLSLSGHKFGGPAGVGALYVRTGTALEPLVRGGGQEAGLRAGTSNVAGAVGLATALELAVSDLATESRRVSGLRDRLEAGIRAAVPGVRVHGSADHRLPHILSVGVDGVAADVLLPALDLAGLAVSAGSACHSGGSSPSHVLVAMGAATDAVVRFSLGWSSTAEEVDAAVAVMGEVVERGRAVGAAR